MRSLVVTNVYPWPATSGTALRVHHTIAALAALGEVDVCSIVNHVEGKDDERADDPAVARIAVLRRPPTARGAGAVARWLVGSRRPRAIGLRDYRELRAQAADWLGAYDFAWLARAESALVLGDLVGAPFVCDLDDLEDRKLLGVHAAGLAPGPWPWLRDRVDLARWRRAHVELSQQASALVVCSELDRGRLALPNAAVVPNCYPAPEPLPYHVAGDPPTLLFAGTLTYAPNADAVSFLVRDIWPRVRAHHGGARLRIVGEHGRDVAAIEAPGVELTGRVASMDEELARADAIVVPIRFGGGTRVKLLEAFAHRIPVVTTAAGAEGLDVRDGEHVLLADAADAFAAACTRVLDDEPLRAALAHAAHDLWAREHRPEVLEGRVQELALRHA